MPKTAKKEAKRQPIAARPRPDVDHEALRDDINKRFSKSLEYLAK